MKLSTVAILAGGAATAFVIPDDPTSRQLSLNRGSKKIQDATQAWWDSLPDQDSILESFEETITADGLDDGSPLDLFEPSSSLFNPPWPHWGGGGGHHRPGHGGGHHGDPTKTIYDLIKSSKYTTKFAELVDDYDDIKALLQDTKKQNHTLFVPTDKAFDRIPDHHKDKKPPKEFVLAVLKYHIVPGLYSARRVVYSHTLPTSLEMHDLGNHSQRLRVRTGLLPFKVYLNFFSKLIAADIVAKNGVIHAIDHILVPPPSQEKIIQLIPSQFSTFRLAMEITGLGEDLDKREREEKERNGGTLFAPTNRAFAKLGPRVNAFLFSDYGKKYLRALLKYHIVANETLYSDAFYEHPVDDGDDDNDDDDNDKTLFGPEEEQEDDDHHGHHGKEFKRIDLPSLLDDKPISVGIARWKRFIHIKVNGRVPVVLQDGLARDGVIQVVGNVLIPPHKHKHDHDGDDDGDDGKKDAEVDIDDLKARLEPYVESDRARGGGSEFWIQEDL